MGKGSIRWSTVTQRAFLDVCRLGYYSFMQREIDINAEGTGDDNSGGNRPDRKRRVPRKATKSHLENAALHYLERFSSSSQNLRAVLLRRVRRSAYHHDTDPEEGATWVEEIISRFLDVGLLDDKAYAENRVRSLHDRGNSRKATLMKLRAKGISTELVHEALESLEQETNEDMEVTAALKFAKRRRLGPYRTDEKREEAREKDMAALARAGFSYHIAQQIISTEDLEDLAFSRSQS